MVDVNKCEGCPFVIIWPYQDKWRCGHIKRIQGEDCTPLIIELDVCMAKEWEKLIKCQPHKYTEMKKRYGLL